DSQIIKVSDTDLRMHILAHLQCFTGLGKSAAVIAATLAGISNTNGQAYILLTAHLAQEIAQPCLQSGSGWIFAQTQNTREQIFVLIDHGGRVTVLDTSPYNTTDALVRRQSLVFRLQCWYACLVNILVVTLSLQLRNFNQSDQVRPGKITAEETGTLAQ